jgi:CubicO group peptidase (beta-lactamase class C family)
VVAIAVAILACRSGSKADANANAYADADARVDAQATMDEKATAGAVAKARVMIQRAEVPGAGFAAVNRRMEVVSGGAGAADVRRAVDASGVVVFEAASIAKLVVVTCVMQMVEAGRLELDTDVAKYTGFPVRHPRWAEPITLRMLLSHRAAIRDPDELPDDKTALGEYLERQLTDGGRPRAAAYLDARPGAAMVYSNVGASLAAFAVERVAGERFDRYSQRRVLAPLHMDATTWHAPAAGGAIATALPYARQDGRFVELTPISRAVYPAAQLYSTARDLGRFAQAILREGRGAEPANERILSAASVRAMLDEHEPLAWQLRSIGGARVLGHEGEDRGASTGLFLDLSAGTAAVVLTNGDAFGSGDRARAEAVQTFLAELLATAR